MTDKNGVELYVKRGKIGILVSPGYGAGWSTWNQKELAYDKRVVDYWLAHKDDEDFMANVDSFSENDDKEEVAAFFESLGYHSVYLGGFNQIVMRYVKPGVKWKISEYDGWESLETENDDDFIAF